jgi:hypothetical protein
VRPSARLLAVVGGLALAGAGGLGTAAVVAQTGAQTPTKTVTVDVGTGEQGPAGPAGPAGPRGPAGAVECPKGSEFGKLVINAPGGQVSIYTCILD